MFDATSTWSFFCVLCCCQQHANKYILSEANKVNRTQMLAFPFSHPCFYSLCFICCFSIMYRHLRWLTKLTCANFYVCFPSPPPAQCTLSRSAATGRPPLPPPPTPEPTMLIPPPPPFNPFPPPPSLPAFRFASFHPRRRRRR